MPEIDHVRGIQDADHEGLPGPGKMPLGGAGVTDYDAPTEIKGDPDAKPKQFIETVSRELIDIIAVDDDYEDDDDTVGPYTPIRPTDD